MADPKDCRNEITQLASSAQETKDQLKNKPDPGTAGQRRTQWQSGALGFGLGIGSAALAAALIYANKDRQKK